MSFQQGLSGLNSSAKQLDAIGNNVSNASTVGFKQSQAQFADLYAASLAGGGGVQTGTGVTVVSVAQQFTQGNITNTSNAMDTAISGPGFFKMTNQNGATLYSRNGQFQIDKDGYMVSNQGHKVNGYQAVGGVVTAAQGPLQIDTNNLLPKQSDNITVGANLDSRAVVPINTAFDPSDPTSYNNSTSLTVYDSLGVDHIGSLYFQRVPITTVGNGSFAAASSTMNVDSTAGLAVGNTVTLGAVTYTITNVVDGTTLSVSPTSAGAVAAAPVTTNAGSADWRVYLTVDGTLVPITAPATPLATLTFNTSGTLLSSLPTAPATAGAGGTVISDSTFTPLGANALPLTFNFGSTSQYGSNFGVNNLTQDGYATGRLNGFSTSSDGVIQGRYSNGQTQKLGQIVLANFSNPQGLQPMGGNEWVESSSSGAPLVGAPGTGSLGIVQSSAVEESNVDMTAELVNMITAQRVYQANAQTIKAQDQVLQTLVNLK